MAAKVQECVYWKEKGNACFKKKNYKEAIDLYDKAIHCDARDATIYANRALCYLRTNK